MAQYSQYSRLWTVYDIAMSEHTPMSGYRRPLSNSDIFLPPHFPLDVSPSPHRNITDHSCLKVYHKDPAQAFSHGPRPTNVDTRVSTDPSEEHLNWDTEPGEPLV